MKSFFEPISVAEQAFLLALHLPEGKAFAKAFDLSDDFGKLLLGLAKEFNRFQILEKKLFDEIDIDQTIDLIENWEKSVGIPNLCFNTNVDIVERRSQVKQIFSKFGGVQINEDFVRVAAVLGYQVEVYTGIYMATFPLRFPISFSSSTKAAYHTLFIVQIGFIPDGMRFPLDYPIYFGDYNPSASASTSDFPLPFPMPFSKSENSKLQCVLNNLAPANVKVIII